MRLLAGFFLFGALMSGGSALALLLPGGRLEAWWRLKPSARGDLVSLGIWGPVLLGSVAIACASAAIGLWLGRAWGRRVAIAILAVNLAADLVQGTVGGRPETLLGLPIGGWFLVYLWRRRPTSG